jgi:hypothetical protein
VDLPAGIRGSLYSYKHSCFGSGFEEDSFPDSSSIHSSQADLGLPSSQKRRSLFTARYRQGQVLFDCMSKGRRKKVRDLSAEGLSYLKWDVQPLVSALTVSLNLMKLKCLGSKDDRPISQPHPLLR